MQKCSLDIINLSVWYFTKVSNDLLICGRLLFNKESQCFTTWTIFSYIWIPCTAMGSSSTHQVCQQCKAKISQPVSLIKISLVVGDSSNIFQIPCKILLISQSVSISSACRAPHNTWRPKLPILINLENSFCSL